MISAKGECTQTTVFMQYNTCRLKMFKPGGDQQTEKNPYKIHARRRHANNMEKHEKLNKTATTKH